jgi:hypothetical protein
MSRMLIALLVLAGRHAFAAGGECRLMALSGHAASTIWSPLSVAERTLANVVHRPQFMSTP